jgi:hypothetical protein
MNLITRPINSILDSTIDQSVSSHPMGGMETEIGFGAHRIKAGKD